MFLYNLAKVAIFIEFPNLCGFNLFFNTIKEFLAVCCVIFFFFYARVIFCYV